MEYTDVLEELCEVQHKMWSRWVRNLKQTFHTRKDGSIMIDPSVAHRWSDLAEIEWEDLSDNIKENIRKSVVDHFGTIESISALITDDEPVEDEMPETPEESEQEQPEPEQSEDPVIPEDSEEENSEEEE